jgi:hypothetical protein
MKKLLIVFMALSLFTACKDDKGGKKDRRETESREKDDYRNDDKPSEEKMTKEEKEPETKSEGWTSADERRFASDCEGTATKNVGAARATEYCDCMLQKLKNMFSSYAQADRELAEPSRAADVQKMADACNGQ